MAKKSKGEGAQLSGKVVLGVGALLLATCVVSSYTAASLYFMDRFYFGTVINGVQVGGMTVEQAKVAIARSSKDYVLRLKERNYEEEQIEGEVINLEFQVSDQLNILKQGQPGYFWGLGTLINKNYRCSRKVSYDTAKLEEHINGLVALQEMTPPENAKIEYVNNQFEIIAGNPGDYIDRELFDSKIEKALREDLRQIDLEENECYKKEAYGIEAPEVLKAKEGLNKYLQAEVTYRFGEETEVVERSLIKDWVSVDENYEISLDEEAVEHYIKGLSDTYSTLGATRNFTTTSGQVVQVSGGNYGWAINCKEETAALIEAIETGLKQEREPIPEYAGTTRENDIGSTYVEISLTGQYLWFYKNGSLITEGRVVTGDVSRNRITPPGTYKLNYKQKNAVLRGPDYETPVSFWMPFNGGIGIHDATWRGSFGGNIYRYNGSHGCVNAPYNVAKNIFNNIEKGTPIICYYE